jgi:hypothetical protein
MTNYQETINKLTPLHLYNLAYYMIMNVLMMDEGQKANNLKEYLDIEDKVSREVNKDTVKTLNSWEQRANLIEHLHDLATIGCMRDMEDLTFEAEEYANNKYVVSVYDKKIDTVIEKVELYAPNQETALAKSKKLLCYITPKEFLK